MVGDTGSIGRGRPLVLLESMKMEIPVPSRVGGLVIEIHVAAGRCHPGG